MSFCTVAWQLARFQLTRRIARSLGDSWASCCIYRVGQKTGHRLMTIILLILNRFNNFSYWKIPYKFAIKCISKISPHLAYVATLPCETLMSAKQAINDKLQGSVATYLRCGGVVTNQIKKGLLLSLWVKEIKIGDYLAKLQARTWLFRALPPSCSSVLAKRTSARYNYVLTCNQWRI